MMRVVLAASIVLAGYGCATAPPLTFMPQGSVAAPARPPTCDLEVLRDTKPQRPYTELGVINFHREWHRGLGDEATLGAALPQIMARACGAGADAILIHVTEERRLEWAMLHVTATAVRFDVP